MFGAQSEPDEAKRRHLWWHGCAVRMGLYLGLVLAVFSWFLFE